MQDPRSIPAPKPEQRPIPQRNQLVRQHAKAQQRRFGDFKPSAFGSL